MKMQSLEGEYIYYLHCSFECLPLCLFVVLVFCLFVFIRAHWYLAVICFPGLDGPQHKPNPLYKPQSQSESQSSSSSKCKRDPEQPSPHTEPISFSSEEERVEGDGLSGQESPILTTHRHLKHINTHRHRVNGQLKASSHYAGECCSTD